MTDEDPETKKSIPAWQTQKPVSQDGEDAKEEIPRMEQAKRFLDADEVRNSTTEKQRLFLKSKGYTTEEVVELLGPNVDIEDEKTQIPPSNPDQTPRTIFQNPPPTNDAPPQQPPQPIQESQPPIITYPEFLTKPTAPSPVITSTRLLTTLTLFSSLSMLLYGSNKYIITPMQDSLTRSRHELLSQASEHLITLNEKLGEAVSEQPSNTEKPLVETEDYESDSDPTEMFHRDIGIQTSPSLLNSPTSRPQTPVPETTDAIPLDAQLSRLSVLSSHLNEINEVSTSEGADAAELSTTMNVLRDFLETMAYTPSSYNFGAQGYSGLVRDMVGGNKEELDEIAKLKASIRSVKGVMLSAKSFPSSGRGGFVR